MIPAVMSIVNSNKYGHVGDIVMAVGESHVGNAATRHRRVAGFLHSLVQTTVQAMTGFGASFSPYQHPSSNMP